MKMSGCSHAAHAKAKNTGNLLADCITGNCKAMDFNHFGDYVEAEKELQRLPESYI